MTRAILLNPGPVCLSDRVRGALAGEDICHREREFAELQDEVRERLLDVYPQARSSHEAVVLTGSGTAAVEAMLATLVPRGGEVLVAANGVYGERMAEMLRAHERRVHMARSDWLEPVDLAAVEALLDTRPGITHLAAVHHETTTGRLNGIAPLAALCRERGVGLCLDAVSSFGAEEIDFEAWAPEGVAATANKCLHGVPGISFVLVSTEAAERESHARSVYLDLSRYLVAQRQGTTPFTQAVQPLYALREALREFSDRGGQAARLDRYRTLAGAVLAGLGELGIRPLIEEGDGSAVLTSYHLPAGWSYERLHDELRRAGFVIYAGQGGLSETAFRISTMGEISDADIERLLQVCRGALAP